VVQNLAFAAVILLALLGLQSFVLGFFQHRETKPTRTFYISWLTINRPKRPRPDPLVSWQRK
jgi:hypothetical protein